jgi:hypothetical protein
LGVCVPIESETDGRSLVLPIFRLSARQSFPIDSTRVDMHSPLESIGADLPAVWQGLFGAEATCLRNIVGSFRRFGGRLKRRVRVGADAVVARGLNIA